MKGEQVRQISVTVISSTKTAVRAAIAAGRTCEDLERLINGENGAPAGAMSFVFQPEFMVLGGHGDVYKRFLETGLLSGYPGEGTPIATSDDPNYQDAALKVMQFHETFKSLKKDVNYSKFQAMKINFP